MKLFTKEAHIIARLMVAIDVVEREIANCKLDVVRYLNEDEEEPRKGKKRGPKPGSKRGPYKKRKAKKA